MGALEELEHALSRDAPSTNYVQGLRKLREETPREVLEICRAWHGSKFAWPGRRSYIWVAREIERAATAITTMRALRDVLAHSESNDWVTLYFRDGTCATSDDDDSGSHER